MTIQETAALLQTMDRVLLLTHVRPDGDTIGSAAALCRVLRDLGKTAYLLPNPGITETYESYAAPYWAEEGFTPEFRGGGGHCGPEPAAGERQEICLVH